MGLLDFLQGTLGLGGGPDPTQAIAAGGTTPGGWSSGLGDAATPQYFAQVAQGQQQQQQMQSMMRRIMLSAVLSQVANRNNPRAGNPMAQMMPMMMQMMRMQQEAPILQARAQSEAERRKLLESKNKAEGYKQAGFQAAREADPDFDKKAALMQTKQMPTAFESAELKTRQGIALIREGQQEREFALRAREAEERAGFHKAELAGQAEGRAETRRYHGEMGEIARTREGRLGTEADRKFDLEAQRLGLSREEFAQRIKDSEGRAEVTAQRLGLSRDELNEKVREFGIRQEFTEGKEKRLTQDADRMYGLALDKFELEKGRAATQAEAQTLRRDVLEHPEKYSGKAKGTKLIPTKETDAATGETVTTYKPESEVVGKSFRTAPKVSEKAQSEIEDLTNSKDLLGQIKETYYKGGGKQWVGGVRGGLVGRAGETVPGMTSTDEQTFRSQVQMELAATLHRLYASRITPTDLSLGSFMPRMDQSPQKFEANLKVMEDNLNSLLKMKAGRTSGRTVPMSGHDTGVKKFNLETGDWE